MIMREDRLVHAMQSHAHAAAIFSEACQDASAPAHTASGHRNADEEGKLAAWPRAAILILRPLMLRADAGGRAGRQPPLMASYT